VTTDDFTSDLELLLRARHPIIFIETEEKDRAESLLLHLADKLNILFYTWTCTKGLRQYGKPAFKLDHEKVSSVLSAKEADFLNREVEDLEKNTILTKDTLKPIDALHEVEKWQRKAIYNFQGLGEDLESGVAENRVIATKLADAAEQFLRHEGSVVITGRIPEDIPNVIKGLITVVKMPLPDVTEFRLLVERIYRDLSKQLPIELHLAKEELSQILKNLQGLTLLEAEKILTKAMVEDQRLDPHDIDVVIEAKKEIVEREGLLEYYPVETTMADVAGINGVKNWLSKRRAIIAEPEKARDFGLSFPKGVLLIGVQGAGKSLCAKAIANDWDLPLLKMDPSSLYNKYIGESEKNFTRAIKTAEKMSPVVLWIDEIEKAFASAGDTDGGLSQRVLGLFLSWLQERKGDVFVVATANDVSKLPPELIRKGRFDEMFFVDLPDTTSRAEILKIHLRKRKRDAEKFDIQSLAESTHGFSGAELEQVIVSSLYTAFSSGGDITTQILLSEAKQTVPLSRTMAEKVASLRAWAKERAVNAN
jgi:SpoVK/Ycf46/Vps4 family AAA+-type ATPase